MTETTAEAKLEVGPSAIANYSRLSYQMWFALAEFVDNSTQSRLNYDSIIDEVLKSEGRPLTVTIDHNRQTKEITIEDNSIGMSKEKLIAALRIAEPTPDSKGRSRYGMGMKTAACWIGAEWAVSTCEFGSGEEWTATVKVNEVAANQGRVPLTMKPVDRGLHYTRITISNLHRVIQVRSEETIREYLGSMYMFDLRPDIEGHVALKLTYNGEEIRPRQETDWDTDPSGQLMYRELPEQRIGDKSFRGWVGVLRKGGRKHGGFSLFQSNRQIRGYPTGWKPKSIFGGVDEEGANNLVAQRLSGVLLLDGFSVSHTKDEVLFEGDEEDIIEKFLIEQTKDLAAYADTRRGKGAGRKWSREQVRELVEDLKSEFTSNEMKDALNNAALPPPEVVAANIQQQVRSLTSEEEAGQLQILPDLRVIISYREVSPYDPHVTFSPGAQGDVLHVIINGLHPYYQTIEAKDSIHECIQQYIFDAVAEFKVNKLQSRINPDSVRRLKDGLLRARADQLANADAEVRARAQADVFGGNGGGAESAPGG